VRENTKVRETAGERPCQLLNWVQLSLVPCWTWWPLIR